MHLLAHHVEVEFIPIYIGQFCLGIWVGWQLVAGLSRYVRRKSGPAAP